MVVRSLVSNPAPTRHEEKTAVLVDLPNLLNPRHGRRDDPTQFLLHGMRESGHDVQISREERRIQIMFVDVRWIATLLIFCISFCGRLVTLSARGLFLFLAAREHSNSNVEQTRPLTEFWTSVFHSICSSSAGAPDSFFRDPEIESQLCPALGVKGAVALIFFCCCDPCASSLLCILCEGLH